MKEAQHPVDFSPYLDGEHTDRRYEEIQAHVDSCSMCRAQLESWRRIDKLFRTTDLDLEVPQWQWSQIESQLHDSRPRPGWLASLSGRIPRYAWAAAASFLVIGSLAVGIRQHRDAQKQETLVAVARFAEAEQIRLQSAGNPFRPGHEGWGNPFTQLESDRIQNQGNPFARR